MENAQPEPSMEEILASIRRIISEDEDDAAPSEPKSASASAAKPELGLRPPGQKPQTQAPQSQPPQPAASQQAPKPPEFLASKAETVEMVKKSMATSVPDDTDEEILDQTAAAVASQAFRTLSQSVRISEGPGRTLEDIVTEMLRPMVKEWLDANLPAIVEEKVEEEVQRVARRRRG